MTILFTSIICFMTGSFKRRWSDKQLLHVGWFVLSADGILINFELTVHLQRILTAKQSAKIILGFWVCFANIIVWKLHCNMGMTSSTINKDKIEKNVVICQWWLVNTSFFKRHWQAPLKVNMQFKAKKVTLLFCYAGLGSLVPIEQLYPPLFTLSGAHQEPAIPFEKWCAENYAQHLGSENALHLLCGRKIYQRITKVTSLQ